MHHMNISIPWVLCFMMWNEAMSMSMNFLYGNFSYKKLSIIEIFRENENSSYLLSAHFKRLTKKFFERFIRFSLSQKDFSNEFLKKLFKEKKIDPKSKSKEAVEMTWLIQKSILWSYLQCRIDNFFSYMEKKVHRE